MSYKRHVKTVDCMSWVNTGFVTTDMLTNILLSSRPNNAKLFLTFRGQNISKAHLNESLWHPWHLTSPASLIN